MNEQNYPINPLIKNRWSPRAMSGEEIKEEEFMPLFEAARWAPSSYNAQPWRFLIAKKGTDAYKMLFSTLVTGNQDWAKNASLLVLLATRRQFEHNDSPSISHSFDAGAAWENLALEGSDRKLVIHGMQGFDYSKAREIFSIPDVYSIEMMLAIGKPGKVESLPENLQKSEAPKSRKSLKEITSFGTFPFK